jgi:hypothetical protein
VEYKKGDGGCEYLTWELGMKISSSRMDWILIELYWATNWRDPDVPTGVFKNIMEEVRSVDLRTIRPPSSPTTAPVQRVQLKLSTDDATSMMGKGGGVWGGVGVSNKDEKGWGLKSLFLENVHPPPAPPPARRA